MPFKIVRNDITKMECDAIVNTASRHPVDSFEQVGCIHSTQGLEFDYCGIIIGRDLRFVDGTVITDPTKEAQSDKSSGIRSCKDPVLADRLIRNTYKTLMSRGQKICLVDKFGYYHGRGRRL